MHCFCLYRILQNLVWRGYLDFGILISGFWFWDLDFGILISGSWFLDLDFWILISGSWFQDLDFWILISGSWILNLGILDLELGCPGTGRPATTFKFLDLSLLIVLCSRKVTSVAAVVYRVLDQREVIWTPLRQIRFSQIYCLTDRTKCALKSIILWSYVHCAKNSLESYFTHSYFLEPYQQAM